MAFGSQHWMYSSGEGSFYDFPIEQSLRFNDDDVAYLSWTPDSAGNRRTFTISVWVKRGNIGASSFYPYIFDGGTSNEHKLAFVNDTLSFGAWAGTDEFNLTTTQLFRDTTAWYHIVVAQDTTQAIAANRVKMYVNGEQVTSFSTSDYPSLNYQGRINNTNEHAIGRWQGGTSRYFDGYMGEFNFVDGQQLGPDSFGEFKENVWVPKDPTGLTYGTNGFRLSFEHDRIVEGFNTVLYKGGAAGIDQPNPVTGVGFQPDLVWMKARDGTYETRDHALVNSIRGFNKYSESSTTDQEATDTGGSFDSDGFTTALTYHMNGGGTDYVAWCWDADNSGHFTRPAATGMSTLLWEGNGDEQSVTGVGFSPDFVWIKNRDNADNHYLFDSVRGVLKGLNSDTTIAEVNSGNDLSSFDSNGFTVGSDGGMNRSSQSYVGWVWDAGENNTITGHSSVTWQGDDADNREVNGFPFTPDLIWIGPRNLNGANYQIYDSVRGFGLGKDLISNGINAEGTESPTYGGIGSVTEQGFITKSGSSGGGLEDAHVNTYQNATYFPGVTGQYVAWGWNAGDGDAVSDTGTNVTNVTRKTSTTNGFSIIDYTVPTANYNTTKLIPHGFDGSPDFMMVKKRTNNANDNQRWAIYHSGLADDQFLKLGDEATDGASTSSTVFDDSAFTSTAFAVGSSGMVGGHPSFDESYICYAWKAVSGSSAFGSYTGQPNETLGFRPGLIMIKNITDNGTDWIMYDSSRNPFEDGTKILRPNLTAGSSEANETITINSTGFTTGTGSYVGAPGKTYVYMAWKGSYSDYVTDYNTDGSLDSRVKADPSKGFSIISYQGNDQASQTIGHGLGSAPSNYMVILKNRTNGSDWAVFHSGIPSGRLKLNTADTNYGNYPIAFNTDTITLPSVDDLAWSSSSNDYIAYAWHSVAGYSDVNSYVGDTSSGVTVNCGFAPGFVIIKNTNFAELWVMMDNTRDVSAPQKLALYSHSASTEGESDFRALSLTDTGFTIAAGADTSINRNGDTFIYMAFATTNTTTPLLEYNFDGSIPSATRANRDYGFSITEYKGTLANATVGHSLTSAPEMIIIKDLQNTNDWAVYHTSLGNTSLIKLNSAGGTQTDSTFWNNTSPTSSVFSLGSSNLANNNDRNIAYAWHSVAGYSHFGSYTGTGASGNVVDGLGFKPAWLMLKKTEDTNGSWRIIDATRSTTNDRNDNLFANLNLEERVDGNGGVSFDSDGFTLNNSGSANANENGKNYIYAAFADTRESAFWLDQSTNSNDWGVNNLEVEDVVDDTPSDNFATMNPLAAFENDGTTYFNGTFYYRDGNLTVGSTANVGNWGKGFSTMAMTNGSGKYYFEIEVDRLSTSMHISIEEPFAVGYIQSTSAQQINLYSPGYGESAFVNGDIVNVAVDMDNLKYWYGKNGTYFQGGDPSAGTGETGTLSADKDYAAAFEVGYDTQITFNFGQKPFKYDPPV